MTLRLHREERDYYSVTITVEPELTGDWEASFDGGTTWVDGTETLGTWTWLVYGPDFEPDDVGMTAEGTEITARTTPLLRLKDDPVVDITEGPAINIWD